MLQGKGHVNGQCSGCSCWTADGSLQDVETSYHGDLRPCCYGLLLWYSKSHVTTFNSYPDNLVGNPNVHEIYNR